VGEIDDPHASPRDLALDAVRANHGGHEAHRRKEPVPRGERVFNSGAMAVPPTRTREPEIQRAARASQRAPGAIITSARRTAIVLLLFAYFWRGVIILAQGRHKGEDPGSSHHRGPYAQREPSSSHFFTWLPKRNAVRDVVLGLPSAAPAEITVALAR
jgi:hypothetical protein